MLGKHNSRFIYEYIYKCMLVSIRVCSLEQVSPDAEKTYTCKCIHTR